MILQRIRIIVGDAGFEPGTSEVWCATNEPSHLLIAGIYIIFIHSKKKQVTIGKLTYLQPSEPSYTIL